MLVPGVTHSIAMARQHAGSPTVREASRQAVAGIAVERTTTASIDIAHFLVQLILERLPPQSRVSTVASLATVIWITYV